MPRTRAEQKRRKTERDGKPNSRHKAKAHKRSYQGPTLKGGR